MPYELIHFRDSEKIIRKKRLDLNIKATFDYVHDVLAGTIQKGGAAASGAR